MPMLLQPGEGGGLNRGGVLIKVWGCSLLWLLRKRLKRGWDTAQSLGPMCKGMGW